MDITKNLVQSDLFSAKDLVIVITGGGSGIGAAMTSALVQTGARKVYILGRRLDSLQNTAATIDPEGNVIIPLKCDVTDLESVSSAVKVVESNEGYIDVLINNAGINGPRHASVYQLETIKDVQSFLLTDYNDWEMVHAVNTCAVGGVAVAFLHLLEAGNGRRGWKTGKFADEEGARPRSKVDGINEDDLRTSQIITVASIAGLHRRITAGIPYATSKIGATYLGKMLATLLAPYGIRSNVVCPGIYPTEMTAGHSSKTFGYNTLPAGRQGNFEDMSAMILYMVGKGGAYLNGAVEITDGGRSSIMPGSF